ncbi:MAG: IS110 family transposase, partial [Candidatus Eisenbacteria bacterium]|nr:IS110 family transposase [Candidatus Eisenbacteria bacterium]
MYSTTIAVDLAKSTFEIAVSDRPGKITSQKRLSRANFLPFFKQTPPANILLEACGSAHYWARSIRRFGHDVTLLPAHFVRPYRKGNKT